MQSPIDVHTALTWGRSRLEGEARDADYLLAAAMHCSLAQLRAFPERLCSGEAWVSYQSWIQRRARAEPLAYLLGAREFWSLPLEVGPGVLIPRPDSELLVEATLQRLPAEQIGQVADVGCGSANLSLAIASERPGLQLLAIERSSAALPWARRNIEVHGGGRCALVQGDLLTAVRPRSLIAVVANLPYIDPTDPDVDPATASHEPAAALYADHDGLGLIAALIAQATDTLQAGGWLLLEHGWRQGAGVLDLLREAGYSETETLNDLAGRPRVSVGRLVETRHYSASEVPSGSGSWSESESICPPEYPAPSSRTV
jgi:release factor glutamine methyltransferase